MACDGDACQLRASVYLLQDHWYVHLICLHPRAGIEEIGVQIEEPFALMPLRSIVRDIEKDLWTITSARKEVCVHLSKGWQVMWVLQALTPYSHA
jgi:hypothetical protein